MKCKYKDSCGYEICMMEECCDFEEGVMTNADRIRAMSDEELAVFFTKREVDRTVQRLNAVEGCVPSAVVISTVVNQAHNAWMHWLRQPAEVPEYA